MEPGNMKLIPLGSAAGVSTEQLIRMVCENDQSGANRSDFRRRYRVLDALEAALKADPQAPSFRLEDADHAVLASLFNGWRFSTLPRDADALIAAVVDAKVPGPEVDVGEERPAA
jgi:hypothetical protein